MDSAAVSRKRQIIATLAVLIVIAVIVAGVAVSSKKPKAGDNASSTTTTQTTNESTAADDTTATAEASTATYKDGTYTATGGYNSPGGAEEIEVTVTLKDGVVTDTSADGKATSGEAKFYQGDFESAYKGLVVGKKIDTLRLSRVAGASLTSGGFNNALAQIKQQAQS